MIQDLAECRDKLSAGGKAVNLGILIRAGFPVPGGFVLTTDAYRASRGADIRDRSNPLAQEICARWRTIGGSAVAVRSSATAEDMAEASMAGQYETFLDITTEDGLLDAVQKCWASLDSPRTRTYLAEHGIDMAKVAMAVVVQKLVPADVAGVMFTANPQTGSKAEMLIEASWGLGEAVVSGLVQPDVLRIDRVSARVVRATIADKQLWIQPGKHEQQLVDEARRKLACLKSADVTTLWKMGLKAVEHFGAEQDLEWAISNGELYLLQSRPITTLDHAEVYERLLQSTRSMLRESLEAGRGPWVAHNIGETLKHPTPLTWSVIRRFMSGDGGFGAMYKEIGFEPSERVRKEGFLLRVAGRAYMDASLAAEMFFEEYPFRYDVELLRSNPDAAQSPPTIPAGTLTQRMRMGRRLAEVNRRVRALAGDFDRKLTERIIPEFERYCGEEKKRDISALSPYELIDLWRQREHRVMDQFAPQSLMPSMVAGMALAELRQTLDENFWDEDPDRLASILSAAHPPDKTLESNAQLWEVAQGRRPVEQWLVANGHRAPDEFDLATARWCERPDELQTMADRLKAGPNPMALHEQNLEWTKKKLDELRAKLSPVDAAELDSRVELARRYLVFRETGKHYLMLGYELLRHVALEAGRRLEIGDGVFQLTQEELFDALRIGYAPIHLIHERQKVYEAEQRVWVPQVIDVEAIETLGEAPRVEMAGSHKAFAVSSGVATGPARIVRSPQEAGELGSGYVLVCPSTDPGWTPLFVNAGGLILECGGTLSHGAVVAREMNIPAVVLPGATSLFADGESITVDGRNGVVSRPAEQAAASAILDYRAPGGPGEAAEDPKDTSIPRELVPPPAGRRERAGNRIRNIAAIFWGVFLAAVFLLPDAWLYRPIFALMDLCFWPLVRHAGKPGAVAVVAAALAVAVMLTQRLLTDNNRLRVAKDRDRMLQKKAVAFPKGSPRRAAMLAIGAPVQMRIVGASMVPLAVLLGPMVLSFVWFPPRVDPAAWNMPPGEPVYVKAMVDANYVKPVELTPAAPLKLDQQSPAAQKIELVKEFLENTLAEFSRPTDTSKLPWEVQMMAEATRHQTLEDLRAYLDAGVPPQQLSWTISTKDAKAGRYPIKLKAETGEMVEAAIVLGDACPPEETTITPAAGPIKSVKVEYTPRTHRQTFCSPLSFLGERVAGPDRSIWVACWMACGTALARMDIGWLGVYLVAYLPAMFVSRRVLKVV
ncbi:MAG: PEP/pyruvate-binding domain-containing protein [Tepidisphaerales bacterium]